jgi:hypothetical protein
MCIIWLLHFEATHLNVMRCRTRRWRYYGSALAFWGPVKLSGNLSAILSNQPAINPTRKHEILKYPWNSHRSWKAIDLKGVAEDNLWPTHLQAKKVRQFGAAFPACQAWNPDGWSCLPVSSPYSAWYDPSINIIYTIHVQYIYILITWISNISLQKESCNWCGCGHCIP